MSDNRDKDKSFYLIPAIGKGSPVSLEVIKSVYIAEGLSVKEIADRYLLPEEKVQEVIDNHKLPELRRAYVREGLSKIQNEQVNQAQRLLDLELNFKKLRLIQLESRLEDFLAYYAKYGDFYKRHPVSGDILRDTDGIALQLHVPNVAKEIYQIKESVTLSEGMKKLLTAVDDIINGKPSGELVGNPEDDSIDMEEIDGLFKKKV